MEKDKDQKERGIKKWWIHDECPVSFLVIFQYEYSYVAKYQLFYFKKHLIKMYSYFIKFYYFHNVIQLLFFFK